MISGFKIGNFKAFSETQYAPIRPLTLIFGPNSSGKSSIIHGLILAHQGMQKGDLDVYRTVIGGESVDLGGFNQYVFKRDTQRQVDWGIELDATQFEGRLREIFDTTNRVTVSATIGMALKEGVLGDIDDDYLKTIGDIQDSQYSDLLEMVQEEKRKKGEPYDSKEIEKYRNLNFTIRDYFEMHRQPQITTCRIEIDGEPLLKMSLRKGGSLRLDTLNIDHHIFRHLIKALLETSTTTDQITPEDFDLLSVAASELITKINVQRSKFLPKGIAGQDQTPLREPNTLLAISKGRRSEDLINALNLFFPRILDEVIKGLAEFVEGQLYRFQYLGPLRSFPPRHLAFSQYHDPNWFAGGGYAWEEVRKNVDLRMKVNEWLSSAEKLSTPYELVIRNLLTIDDLEKHYSKIVGRIENRSADNVQDHTYEGDLLGDIFGDVYSIPGDLKSIEHNLAEVRELILLDKRTETTVSHRDVGIGISQVLPVLVSAYANKSAIVAIEQPEIHLHPALQAELGDVFMESALGVQKNTFIIETHSEHLILRILRRIRETNEGDLPKGLPPIKPQDVQVIYAEPTSEGAILHALSISEEGEFLEKWPDGFFPERAKELF
jgi:predicted ATPase